MTQPPGSASATPRSLYASRRSNGTRTVDISAPVRMSDEVSERIRELIMSENLAEGARLPSERELSERFGASRPTVSQALRRLSLMGMVEIRRGSGAYVLRQPETMVTASVNLMLDLREHSVAEPMQFRLWLETIGAEEAARRAATPGAVDSEAIMSALTRLVDATHSASAWIAADTVFHALIVKSAGNAFLAAIYESVHTAILGYEYDRWVLHDAEPTWIGTEGRETQLWLHKPIADSVVLGDVSAARAAVLRHHEAMLAHLEAAQAPRRRRASQRVAPSASYQFHNQPATID